MFIREHGDQGPLTAARIAARQLIGPLLKTHSAGGRYDFENHADVLALTVGPLLQAGLFVSQNAIGGREADEVGIATRITHTSGAFVEHIAYGKVEPGRGMSWCQALGSTMSYLRKYELKGALMLAGEDKDAADQRTYDQGGNAAPKRTRESFEASLKDVTTTAGVRQWSAEVAAAGLNEPDRALLGIAWASKVAAIEPGKAATSGD